MASTLSREDLDRKVEATFDAVDKLDEQVVVIEQTLPEQAREIQSVMSSMLSQVPPLGTVLASRLLEVDRKTVAHWADQGLLVEVDEGTSHRRRFDPLRLHQVRHVVRQLRSAGQSRNLLDAIWFRLEDQAVLDREDLARSLQQLRDGDVVEAY
ncbi:MerR family transcriptional regulator [Saccharopolyspora dendranthemae]|uniref:HTH merR-type domain-containing protein n=1 Tax=Saccharopolyspora dendranthemae TaxID=1181886 RepID=A0A561U652_9PSEU|nr:MerR family transcriptional regulator [Saccharopolyspora dendranthemae]TWF94841.1 hypothetical protein FHU35_13559 [Saccharopolyspora dendranthemae]